MLKSFSDFILLLTASKIYEKPVRDAVILLEHLFRKQQTDVFGNDQSFRFVNSRIVNQHYIYTVLKTIWKFVDKTLKTVRVHIWKSGKKIFAVRYICSSVNIIIFKCSLYQSGRSDSAKSDSFSGWCYQPESCFIIWKKFNFSVIIINYLR